jgi:hypothetical protein
MSRSLVFVAGLLGVLLFVLSLTAILAPSRTVAAAQLVQASDAPGGEADRLDRLARRFDDGVRAWRRGDREVARGEWLDLLDELPPEPAAHRVPERRFDRGALLYALGNAAYRAEDELEAVGWYRAAERYWPRSGDLQANLELAAERAGVPARVPRGPGRALLELMREVTPPEARWLALLGLLPLGAALLHEALAGGRGARLLAALAALVSLTLAAPLLTEHFVPIQPETMVIDPEGLALRSEPLADAARIGRLEAGEQVLRLDRLADWVRIENRAGERGWISAAGAFDLDR